MINAAHEYRVLVVDDDPEVREALVDELGEIFAVEECSSAEEAMGVLALSHFDAVVSDVRMPGLGGVALLEHVSEERPDMVRVFLTGYGDEHVGEVARATGSFKLRKPWGDELEILLRHSLQHRDQQHMIRQEVLDYVSLVPRPHHSIDGDAIIAELVAGLDALEWVIDVEVTKLPDAPEESAVQSARAPERYGLPGEMTVVLGAPNVGGWFLRVRWRSSPSAVRLIEFALQQARDALEMRCLADQVQDRVSELERARHEVARRDGLAAMGALAASVAHDVRSPLTVLGTSLALLEEELLETGGLTLELQELVEDGRIAHETISRVIASMHRVAVSPGTTEDVDVQETFEVLDRLLLRECHRQGVKLRFVPMAQRQLQVRATTGEVCQILLNLVNNAARANAGKGEVQVSAQPSRGGVALYVTDEGPGVDEEVREHIFAPFVSTHEGGMGLGLAISREMARRHKGELRVVDTPNGRGARFELWLPAPEPVRSESELQPGNSHSRSERNAGRGSTYPTSALSSTPPRSPSRPLTGMPAAMMSPGPLGVVPKAPRIPSPLPPSPASGTGGTQRALRGGRPETTSSMLPPKPPKTPMSPCDPDNPGDPQASGH